MIRTGIIGGAGYTAGELIRLLINHPCAEIVFVHSNSNAGNKITDVHSGLYGETDLVFTDQLFLDDIDLLYFCTAHGDTRKFLDSRSIPDSVKIIDLSTDYRIAGQDNPFIYGLPELNREAICSARYVANPGCFATGIQSALLPLAVHSLLNHDIHVNAITGSTGAGIKPSETSHFSWRNNNVSIYKPFTHQHLSEIKQSLTQLQPDMPGEILFIPVRGNFSRGIFSTVYTECNESQEDIIRIYQTHYKNHPFTFVTDHNPDLKQVVNTNKCLVHLQKHGDILLITSVIDNLLKGASGQAVHNMNLMFNLEETAGLHLKSSGF
ncbi:MAG: N-acetyl-gamma-glutamyl-phosphate reductase [Tannerella sp.]|jgi:N-acetyl-gamma-glutamyl-phosphate reductase|nr:N-acetyl-gamma-glutamyl-phosphate reductase [Tannerella sp.]